ncbi:HPr kinase/phosphorylase [Paracoccus luteus]|uniref:HPr kinase/phosphorylase n=1 Tax=Paracoccus luteus TaxID=2508543 RepID=UPI0010700DA7|nr:serine kinase [Paracoccus luteus]
MTGTSDTVHGSAVALDGQGLLILGPAGVGKSALALALMALGAGLVADDRVRLTRRAGALVASCPPALSGLIEARGIGILRADPAGDTALALVVDLGRAEDARLPPERRITLHEVELSLVLGPMGPHLGAALRQMLIGGRFA